MSRVVLLIVVVGLAGVGCSAGPDNTPAVKASYSKTTGKLELVTYDTNRDGRIDAWSYMDGTRLVRMEIDLNFDGMVDRWEYYADDGSLEKVGFSRANVGKVDAWAYEAGNGQVARIEVSTRRDGKVNRWESYEQGKQARADEDTNGDGKPDKWETYRDGALASVAIDTDNDGRPNRRLIYGADGVKVEKLK
jgi:hypothetical protein